MEKAENPELLKFRALMTTIREESAALKNAILSEDTEKEESEMLSELDRAIQVQALSTLSHLVNYQKYGWRVVIDA